MVTPLGMPRKDVVIPLDGSKGGRSFKKGCGHPNEGCGHSIRWVQGRKVIQERMWSSQ